MPLFTANNLLIEGCRYNARQKKADGLYFGVLLIRIFFVSGSRCLPYLNKLHFGGEFETNILEVFLGECKRITCVGKEDITTVLVYRHIGVLTALEVGELCLVIGLYPASLMY